MLNRIWLGFILSAFVYAVFCTVTQHDLSIFSAMMQSIFDMAKLSVEIAIGLIGILAFWLGISRIAEQSGVINQLAQFLSPVFQRLMPEVPKGHAATGHVTMNLAANMMGLDNAATPLGLKAMQSLQSLNPLKDTASNAQILFLVLNTSSVTLFPVTVFMYRAQAGAVQPTDVFLPILLATFASTMVGLSCVCWLQKINLWNKKTVLFICLLLSFLVVLVSFMLQLSAQLLSDISAFTANFLILSFIVAVLFIATRRGVEVYQSFIEGAKEGFQTAVTIIPYLLAMLIAIGLVRASGLLDGILNLIRVVLLYLSVDVKFVDALPTALIKPLSGSGARAMMVETMNTHGADSFAGRVASIMQGSTETTFYVLAVYFGSVGIKYTRYAISCGLLADAAGLTAAILVGYWFYA